MSDDLPVGAFVSGDRRVTYIYADGHTLQLHGNHPYRDNNPGNLSYAGKDGEARAKAAGAITVDPTGPFKFAVFPNPAAGEVALSALIKRHVAAGHTIYDLMRRYAPPSSNNTTAYVAAVAIAVGAKATDKLSSLSASQIAVLEETIRQVEGWRDRNRELSPPSVTPAR